MLKASLRLDVFFFAPPPPSSHSPLSEFRRQQAWRAAAGKWRRGGEGERTGGPGMPDRVTSAYYPTYYATREGRQRSARVAHPPQRLPRCCLNPCRTQTDESARGPADRQTAAADHERRPHGPPGSVAHDPAATSLSQFDAICDHSIDSYPGRPPPLPPVLSFPLVSICVLPLPSPPGHHVHHVAAPTNCT